MGRSPAAAKWPPGAESVDLGLLPPAANSASSQEMESSDFNRPSSLEMDRFYSNLPPLEGTDVELPPDAGFFQETVSSSAGVHRNLSRPLVPPVSYHIECDSRGKEIIHLDSDGDENKDPMEADAELFWSAMQLMGGLNEGAADVVEGRGEGSGQFVDDWIQGREEGRGKSVGEWFPQEIPADEPAKAMSYDKHVEEEEEVNLDEDFGRWARERARRRKYSERIATGAARQFAVPEEVNIPAALPSYDEREVDNPDEPFSIAKKIVMEQKAAGRTKSGVLWKPSNCRNRLHRVAPPLKDLCFQILAENCEAIESLEGIPDALKHSIVLLVCRNSKMSDHVLGLYLHGSPTEIHLSDGSWATEDVFVKALTSCDTSQLTVVQLDLCGRCLPDYVLQSTLASSPNSLLSLTTLSLKGAYRLSDDGLNSLITSAPSLRSINLGHCSLLTSRGISNLAYKMNSVLRELYLDACQNVDAMVILPALKTLKYLEVLSVASVPNVCDKFVCELLPFCGPSIKELVLANCQELTVASMKAVAANCPNLCGLDIQKLPRLVNSALKYLANGCRSLKSLKLRRNMFSDETIAAFLEASGGSLTELSLNHVEKVSSHTAAAISHQCCQSLQSLDLSFCRELTDEQLGLIVDSCLNLKMLKLFGCSQITEFFFEGHSNPLVQIIGLKGSILEHIEMPKFL